MEEKVFLDGSGKEAPFCKGKGDVINFSLRVEDVAAKADGEWIQLSICRRKNGVDKYGNSHYICLNTYKKQENQGGGNSSGSEKQYDSKSEENPFA